MHRLLPALVQGDEDLKTMWRTNFQLRTRKTVYAAHGKIPTKRLMYRALTISKSIADATSVFPSVPCHPGPEPVQRSNRACVPIRNPGKIAARCRAIGSHRAGSSAALPIAPVAEPPRPVSSHRRCSVLCQRGCHTASYVGCAPTPAPPGAPPTLESRRRPRTPSCVDCVRAVQSSDRLT